MNITYRTIFTTLLLLSVGILTLIAQDSLSTDQVVIVGTKFAIPVERSGKTTFKIDQSYINQSAGKNVADLLNEVPGLHIDGNYGSPGTNISYSARGGRSRHTLILIDGIAVNDPSNIDAFYDLRLVPIETIESIEILKGGLSSLYGSSAATAVINIKTISPATTGTKVFMSTHGGSYGTFGGNIGITGGSSDVNYLMSIGGESSNGFSSADDEGSATPFANDGRDVQNVMAKLELALTEQLSIDFLAGYDKINADFDAGAFTDADNQNNSNQVRIGITPTYKYENGKISLKTLLQSTEREFVSAFSSQFEAKNVQIDLTHEHRLSDEVKFFAGINRQDLNYSDVLFGGEETLSFNATDPYISLVYGGSEGLTIHGGLRMNIHSEYGSQLVYNLNPAYLFDAGENAKIKIFGSISTAYVTPSLFQLNDGFFGNKELNPEETKTVEFGGSYYLDNGITLNVSWFDRNENNPVGFLSSFDDQGNFIGGMYVNEASERKVTGIETDINVQLTDDVSATAYYTHVSSDDESSFTRLPNQKFGASLSALLATNLNTTIRLQHVGTRMTTDFRTFDVVELDAYTTLDLSARYTLPNQNFSVKAALNNVFDADFVGVLGFTTRGRNFDIGFNYQF